MLSIATTLGIVTVLLSESYHFFAEVGVVRFFTELNWSPLVEPFRYGIWPLLSGTLLIAVGAALIAIPLGLMAAIYLSEYASERTKNIAKPIMELLAGIPTIVYGFFAVAYVTPMLQKILPQLPVYNALSGFIVVGIMIFPMVASLSEDAIAAVPKQLREGGIALGATKNEVIRRVVLPSAASGVIAAFLLAISRAVGETMAVTLAAGSRPQLTLDPTQEIQTMSAYIVMVAKGDVPHGSREYYTVFAVGLMLFLITLVMNLLAAKLVGKKRGHSD